MSYYVTSPWLPHNAHVHSWVDEIIKDGGILGWNGDWHIIRRAWSQ